MTDELDTLRPEVREALEVCTRGVDCVSFGDNDAPQTIRAELLRLTDENARLNKIESLATEQRLQMEDVELYLMDVSQPDDEDAHWCDRMKSAIELLVQDCNYAIGQKNKAEAELAQLKERISASPVYEIPVTKPRTETGWAGVVESVKNLEALRGKRVRLVVEE